MISPSLHPDPISAVCERRRRWGFGLTPRSIVLLLVGFVWLIPGFWDWRLAFAMPAWDALVLLAALLDGLRLPAPLNSPPAAPGLTPRPSTARPRSS